MLYHTHSVLRDWETTTSLLGTHVAKLAYVSSVFLDWDVMSNTCSFRRLSRNKTRSPRALRSNQSICTSTRLRKPTESKQIIRESYLGIVVDGRNVNARDQIHDADVFNVQQVRHAFVVS